MAIIDSNVERLIKSVGYSSVVVVRKKASPGTAANTGHGLPTPQRAKRSIPNIFLQELPDTAGLKRVRKLVKKKGGSAALATEEEGVRPPMRVPKPLSLEQLGMECGFLDETGLGALARDDSVEAIVS